MSKHSLITDFNRIGIFLSVVRKRSLKKASEQLGITQSAVAQNIRLLEKNFGQSLLTRNKNGSKLTNIGYQIMNIFLDVEKATYDAKEAILQIKRVTKETNFSLGATHDIGDHILPKYLNAMKNQMTKDISVSIKTSNEILNDLKNNKIDLALIDSVTNDEKVFYKKWKEDEVVIFSNQELPRNIRPYDLKIYKWICRDRDSYFGNLFSETLKKTNMPDCEHLNIITTTTSSMMILNLILKSPKNDIQTCSIMSKFAIADLLNNQILHYSTLPIKMKRDIYIAYLKEREEDKFIDNAINFLTQKYSNSHDFFNINN